MSDKTIRSYARAVRRVSTYLDCLPDHLKTLQVGDIDAQHQQVHIRRSKSHKDHFVPLPDLAYHALQSL